MPRSATWSSASIYDADTKQNLTDARLRQLNRVAWDQLPLDLAIKKVKGNGSRKLAIFSDADCPFCKRLESEMKSARQRDDLHVPVSDRLSCIPTRRASRR